MLRHLFVTLEFPPDFGGVARYYYNLTAEFFPGSCSILAPKNLHSSRFDSNHSCPVIRQKLLSARWVWPRWLPLLWHVSRLIRQRHIDLLHVGQVLPVGTVALLTQRWLGIPYIVYTHGLDILTAQQSTRKRTLLLKVLRSARLVVANSHFTESKIKELGIPQEKIVLVFPGCSWVNIVPERTRREQLIRQNGLEGKRVILTVSRLVPRKGIDSMIHALPQLLKIFPTLHYLVVGHGPDRERLGTIIQNQHLSKQVTLVGAVEESDLPAFYSLAELFVMVPRIEDSGRDVEGFGIVYLEAGAFAKPVVASRSGGVQDAVAHGETGLLVEPGNQQELVAAIHRLLSDQGLGRRLGEEAKRRVETQGTWSARAKPLFDRLTSLSLL